MTAMVAKRTIHCDKYESKLGRLYGKSESLYMSRHRQ